MGLWAWLIVRLARAGTPLRTLLAGAAAVGARLGLLDAAAADVRRAGLRAHRDGGGEAGQPVVAGAHHLGVGELARLVPARPGVARRGGGGRRPRRPGVAARRGPLRGHVPRRPGRRRRQPAGAPAAHLRVDGGGEAQDLPERGRVALAQLPEQRRPVHAGLPDPGPGRAVACSTDPLARHPACARVPGLGLLALRNLPMFGVVLAPVLGPGPAVPAHGRFHPRGGRCSTACSPACWPPCSCCSASPR